MKEVTLGNVILIVGTKKATDSAHKYRRQVTVTRNLDIIIIDRPLLEAVVDDPSSIVDILYWQAPRAMSKLPPPPKRQRPVNSDPDEANTLEPAVAN
jgi:hypothetical protein